MDKHLQRAIVLIEQSRYDMAEQELRQALAADPDDAMAHAYFGFCLGEREDYARATEEVRTAIRLAPDWPHAHYLHALLLRDRNRLDEAEEAVSEALRLEPDHPKHHAMLASIRLAREDWAGALQAADQGVRLDPEHNGCQNLRAMALTKLGRTEEAGAAMASTLARDPENPVSHANQGWNYLHQKNSQKALEHFREALRLDPEMDYARAGMVEALKSRNPVYAVMLGYFLWMSRLSTRARWAVVLGAYLAFRVLGYLAENNPTWAPWLRPLLIAYFVFALLTWLASPLFNLLLRLNRYGRHALSRDQTLAANCVGVALVPAAIAFIAWLATGNALTLLLAVYFGLLLLPVSAIFRCERGWPRNWMVLYTAGMAALGPLYIVLFPLNQSLAIFLLQVFLFGSLLSGLVANFLIMSTVRR